MTSSLDADTRRVEPTSLRHAVHVCLPLHKKLQPAMSCKRLFRLVFLLFEGDTKGHLAFNSACTDADCLLH